jgi:MFS transporter, PAT family, beta-lactamase induction signal transducer AmpG
VTDRAEAPVPPPHRDDLPWWHPLTWVPSLYFVQGLPYVIANNVSVVLYKQLQVSNAEIAFYTSWFGLVWAFKALWSPFVDATSTKRRWTLAMQGAMAPVLAMVAFALPLPSFVQISLALFLVLAVLSATHDVAADGFYMLGLRQDQQSAFVGVRSTFWRVALVFGEGGLVMLAGFLARQWTIEQAWTATMLVAAGLFAGFSLFHALVLPRPGADLPRERTQTFANTGEIVASFFRKEGIVSAILFLAFYRFAENHLSKLVSPFLLDGVDAGGLGLSAEAVGFAKGTVGVVALVVGGILGGIAIWRDGLRRWLWPMVFALNAPDLVYVWLAWAQPENYPLVVALIGVEQFGYGFGFTAYMMFMIRLAEGEHKTAHYAFGTGLMALFAWAAQSWSGWMQEQLGYDLFFWYVLLWILPGIWVAWLVDIPADFGRRKT